MGASLQGCVSLTARQAGWARTVISVSAWQVGGTGSGGWPAGVCLTDCKAGWMGEDCNEHEYRAEREKSRVRGEEGKVGQAGREGEGKGTGRQG